MADKEKWTTHQQSNAGAAVINLEDMEMEIVDDDDASDYDNDFTGKAQKRSSETKPRKFMDDVRQKMTENVSAYMWDTGSQQAKKAWNLYGNIDLLRPYFNVEPHQVRSRLLFSLIPTRPSSQKQRVPDELYGPLMVLLTLIALLLFQMKTSGHHVEEGTLMGTAFGVCFTYWIGTSSFLWFLAYVCNVHIRMMQIMSMLGYGLFGHCMVILLGTIIHTSHDHIFFYCLWAIIGGLSSLRMVTIILSRTQGPTQRMIVSGTIIVFHLLFLLYLHFAYHQIVEDISEMLENKPIIQLQDAAIDVTTSLKGDNSINLAAKVTMDTMRNIAKVAKDSLNNSKVALEKTVEGIIRNVVVRNDSVTGSNVTVINVKLHANATM